jgi:predicted dinucleotide-utilizing enzyme
MEKQSIAIVGLGEVGSAFLAELLDQPNNGVEIIAVVENDETPGLELAKASGIRNVSIDELVAMGDSLDILFDLTHESAARKDLREKLKVSGNRHTIVATENIARMILMLISSGVDLPNKSTGTGY